MKALVIKKDTFGIEEVPVGQPLHNQVLVRVDYAALNRRDQWIREGKYPSIKFPSVLGSDGCGEVIEVGKKVSKSWLNKTVIINPNINWGANNKVQAANYEILGMPSWGAFAEYVVVNEDRIIEKPVSLREEQASALPLAGMTAFNALFNKGKLENGQNVLISGVGGGVAQFAFQFALAVGANVYVSSSKEEVLDKCMKLGAAGRINYHRPDAYKTLKKESGGFDLIIDSACGEQLNDRLMSLKPGGKYVFYGATNGVPSKLNVHAMFWNHWQLLGSTMGSDEDFKNMIEFVGHHQIEPIIDGIFEFNDIIHAFDRMKDGFHFGKIVVKIS